ncbi:MAG TPA: hypothetical protein VGN01_01770 [Acidobacteriaceae bacterium]
MRVILCTVCLAFAFSPVLQPAPAQTTRARARPTPVAPATPSTSAAPCACAPQPVRHVLPYTATQQTTRTRSLPDGTTIKTSELTLLARDAQGRTRRDTLHSANGETTHFIEIYDSVTQIRYIWNTGVNLPQVVTVYRPRPNPQTPPPQQPRRYFPYRTESLPPQTIGDLYVEGTRTTRITPAGYEGNDRDIAVTTENWFAPSIGLQMRSLIDDPRTGKVVTETTDFKQADPDPALFQPPAGFTLKDANPSNSGRP